MNTLANLPFSPAAERNAQPILAALREVLPPSGLALEVASGTGQHAVFFAQGLPGWHWQPSDANAHMLPAIAARTALAQLDRVRPPLHLDVQTPPLGGQRPRVRCHFLRQHAAHCPLVRLRGVDATGGPTPGTRRPAAGVRPVF